MTQAVNSNILLKRWINVFVIINIIYFIFQWGYYWIVEQLQPFQSFVVSSNSILCIINIIGAVYLSRNLRFGIYLQLGAPIIILVLQFLFIGEIAKSIYAFIILAIITSLILCLKKGNKTIWSQLNKGIDFVHFRHIYQLSSLAILLFVGYASFDYLTVKTKVSEKQSNRELYHKVNEEDLLKELDNPNITLGEISKIEKQLKEIPSNYEARIMALRHILAGHIVPHVHDIESFRMAYLLRKDALSKEQQRILDWFFYQPNEIQNLWERSEGATSINAFQQDLKRIMKRREKNK